MDFSQIASFTLEAAGCPFRINIPERTLKNMFCTAVKQETASHRQDLC